MAERVYCLYRVSTAKQVDHDDKNNADIPMQRKACHEFASRMGWEIVGEVLVFMFDRLGCKSDETPFVVEWFVKKGIQVWSINKGEQRFESHTDRLFIQCNWLETLKIRRRTSKKNLFHSATNLNYEKFILNHFLYYVQHIAYLSLMNKQKYCQQAV